jgi:hypothetical protein
LVGCRISLNRAEWIVGRADSRLQHRQVEQSGQSFVQSIAADKVEQQNPDISHWVSGNSSEQPCCDSPSDFRFLFRCRHLGFPEQYQTPQQQPKGMFGKIAEMAEKVKGSGGRGKRKGGEGQQL